MIFKRDSLKEYDVVCLGYTMGSLQFLQFSHRSKAKINEAESTISPCGAIIEDATWSHWGRENRPPLVVRVPQGANMNDPKARKLAMFDLDWFRFRFYYVIFRLYIQSDVGFGFGAPAWWFESDPFFSLPRWIATLSIGAWLESQRPWNPWK